MRFQDKVAIVTGGSSGIGKEVATRFVAEGGSVVIIGRDAAKAEAAAEEIDATGKRSPGGHRPAGDRRSSCENSD